VRSSLSLSRSAVACACVGGFEMVNPERSSTSSGLNARPSALLLASLI
jgi:hypothetical protein